MEANNSKKHVVTHLLLLLGSIVMLFPFIWMILSSFKTVGEQMSIPMKILPGSFGYLENYRPVSYTHLDVYKRQFQNLSLL